ncbi:MAG: hypothetical protein ACFE9T_06815 [Promethearchaeota archaeon]
MADIKDYIWVFPIIGAVLGIITFLAPVASWTQSYSGYYGIYSLDWYYWIWGFTLISASYGPYSGRESGIIDNVSLLSVSIVCTIIIAISIVTLIIGGVLNKRSTEYNMNVIVISSIGATLLLIGPIIWLIGADWPYITPPFTESDFIGQDFWDWFDVNFGIIAPFIGAVIAIPGIVGHWYIFKYEGGIREPRKEIIGKKITPMTTSPVLKFCPECGQKIEQEGVSFCSSCGFKF